MFKFVEAEPLGNPGAWGEKKVWEAVIETFKNHPRDGVAFWLYCIFDKQKHIKWEPDILIVDRELGLVIVEVKSYGIEDITNIIGTKWEMKSGFSPPTVRPFIQAENQLRALKEQCEPKLGCKVTGRVMVALPKITKAEWEAKGFDCKGICTPPILFKEDLRKNLLRHIEDEAIIIDGKKPLLNPTVWNHLLNLLCGVKPPHLLPGISLEPILPIPATEPRSKLVSLLKTFVAEIDWQQVSIGREIPPGPQRIRGIAGSGKTVLLCQKAARMHWRYPDWDIALVFFTRSLYEPAIELVSEWLRYFSGGGLEYDPNKSKLKILHAWGERTQPKERTQPGLYSTIVETNNISNILVKPIPFRNPPDRLAALCKLVLEKHAITPQFDAILIDEGSDLVVDNETLKFEDKQAIYWFAWQALRPVDISTPDVRRLIWAYDEAQSLDSLKVPTAKELFGDELSSLLSRGTQYIGGIKKAEVMRRCYRIPAPILTAAQAIGMGLLRPEGMLSGITNKKDWERIGFEVKAGEFYSGHKVTLHKRPDSSANPAPQYWQGKLIEFETYKSRESELIALFQKIKHNINHDSLNPSKDILVIVLGSYEYASKLENDVAGFLIRQGINVYIPTAQSCNVLHPEYPNNKPNKFWCENGVTISRIHRAKGNEAYMVYVVGLDNVAKDESNITLRNQLFVAMTRSKAWVNLSGIGDYPMYEEMQKVIKCGDTITFTYKKPKHIINDSGADDAG